MSGTAAFIVGLVIAISDGDTLTVLSDDRQQVKVRLAEIDAPEKQQAFGTRSRQSLGELCHEKHAEVRVVDVDRYGRTVGRVACDGTDANEAQVRRGMAWVYDRYAQARRCIGCRTRRGPRVEDCGRTSERSPRGTGAKKRG